MNNKKIGIFKTGFIYGAFLFLGSAAFAADLKSEDFNLAKNTIQQKTASLLSEDALKGDKITTISSFKDLNEVLNQADQLCNDLKKHISWFGGIWSKISKNPVFENQLFESIEKLQHQLLLYNSSDGKNGKTFSKEKLVELVTLISKYKELKTKLDERSIFINYFEQPFFNSIASGFSWVGKKIRPALELCLALIFFVPLCATILGIIDAAYFGRLTAFFYPFTFLKNFLKLGTSVTATTVGTIAVAQAEVSNAVYGDNWFASYLNATASAFCSFQNFFGGNCTLNTY